MFKNSNHNVNPGDKKPNKKVKNNWVCSEVTTSSLKVTSEENVFKTSKVLICKICTS